MAKIKAATKTKITKLFKKGFSVKEIKAAVIEEFPRITPTRIRVVLCKHLMGKADELWSKAIKQVGKCEICSRKDSLEAHHLIRRENRLFRWDLSNGVCLCVTHHKFGTEIAAHGSNDVTSRFAEWMQEHRSGQWMWMLENRDLRSIEKVTCDSLLRVCTELEEIIKDG